MEQEAVPVASVGLAEHDCEAMLMVIIRPTMGVVPSSLGSPNSSGMVVGNDGWAARRKADGGFLFCDRERS